jgi:outer membrane protein OmpA-like peptidoglycan-associated protein/peroxiredoxin
MKYHIFYFLVLSLFFYKASLAQVPGNLNVGDKAPNLVLSSTNNSIQSFTFPYQNKVVLLFFWSSSVSKSKENIYKYNRLHSKYSNLEYKSCDGFDVISVALQSDKIAWAEDLIKFGLLKMNNCIAQKGYSDPFVKSYKITQTPTSYLIDEFGKILFVNPTIKTIIDYLNQRKNSQLNVDFQTKLAGKIMYGSEQLTPLANEKIWFLNDKNDTIQSVILDEKGKFLVKNINTALNLRVYIKLSSKINEEQIVFLTSENGEIVSPFVKNEIGYDYILLDVEMQYLKPLYDNEPVVKTDKGGLKELYVSEQLFKAKTTVLSKEAILKLNTVISKLKENPKTRVEIISHTDSNGDAKLNSTITLNQSNSIAAYLISGGIVKTRIKTIGKGEEEILNKCKDGVVCSEAEHNKNRRTEFKFFQLQ